MTKRGHPTPGYPSIWTDILQIAASSFRFSRTVQELNLIEMIGV
jgi:hypothetical protein